MRVCLFGCGGFIGSHLVEWLLGHTDAAVLGTDIHSDKIRHLLREGRFRFHDSDIRADRDFTRRLIEDADVVVDLVAIARPAVYLEDPLHVFELDFLENLRVAQACAETGTRLVQFSSSEVYGRPWYGYAAPGTLDRAGLPPASLLMNEDVTPLITGPVHKTRWVYAASKHLLERAIHAYGLQQGLDYTIVRPFNFLGPRFDDLPSKHGDGSARMFSQFMDALIHGTRMALVDSGHVRRSFVYIDDAVECLGRIITDSKGVTSRQIFNIGNPANDVTIREFAQLMYDRYREHHWDGVATLPEMVPVPQEEFFGDGYEDYSRGLPDISKARRLLDWEPTSSLDDILIATMDAYLAEHAELQLTR